MPAAHWLCLLGSAAKSIIRPSAAPSFDVYGVVVGDTEELKAISAWPGDVL